MGGDNTWMRSEPGEQRRAAAEELEQAYDMLREACASLPKREMSVKLRGWWESDQEATRSDRRREVLNRLSAEERELLGVK